MTCLFMMIPLPYLSPIPITASWGLPILISGSTLGWTRVQAVQLSYDSDSGSGPQWAGRLTPVYSCMLLSRNHLSSKGQRPSGLPCHTPRGRPHFLLGRCQGPSRPVDTVADGEIFLLQVVLAFSAKCPQLREWVLSTSLCPLLGSCAPGRVRGQRAHLLPESTRDVQGRVCRFCYETQAGDGVSVTQTSRDMFHMVHPSPRLAPSPIARPAGPAVGSSCLNYSRAQRETQVWNLSRGGRLRGSPACWSGRLCLSPA